MSPCARPQGGLGDSGSPLHRGRALSQPPAPLRILTLFQDFLWVPGQG